MFYCLPPAGNPVRWSSDVADADTPRSVFSPYSPCYFQSGTAALAAALLVAKSGKPVARPEVILPAYGCPDLVSAAVFAGLKPVLVDFEADRPWMAIEPLQSCVNENTVAIVAVNLLGISERFNQIRPIAERVNALLIEDSAQAFPGKNEACIWEGDLVVLSFGRGKPVSLLGGGAVLVKDRSLEQGLLSMRTTCNQEAGDSAFRLKTSLYNTLLNPRLYWLPASLPFLHLGETRYHPLHSISSMHNLKQGLLATNIEAYQSRSLNTQQEISRMVRKHAECCIDLPAICDISPERPLLRYPVLVKQKRNRVLASLIAHGLGGSPMYPSVLPLIEGLDLILDSSLQYPNAADFAVNFMTLPTHDRVNAKDLGMIGEIFNRLL